MGKPINASIMRQHKVNVLSKELFLWHKNITYVANKIQSGYGLTTPRK